MRRLNDWTGLDENDRGAVAAIGNFDGVHRGHRRVIDLTKAEARGRARPLGVVTFEPHPRQVLAPDAPPFRLTNAAARAHRLADLGVERLYELPFAERLMSLAPAEFAREVIRDGLGLVHVVVGHDFRFGKDRAGDAAGLARLGEAMGFGVTLTPLLADGGEDVSSTRIRQALTDGAPDEAARLLGHLHRIEGEVLHGDARGRDLGYPTANLSIDGLHPPRFGVYAVTVDVLDGPHAGPKTGVASMGVRPMFGENRPNLEVHLFDFDGDLYGATLSVGLVAFLRPEATFASVDALVRQMQKDSAQARDRLSGEV